MIRDIGTVVWKEWKESLLLRGAFRGGIWNVLIFVGIFGILLPLQSGRAWVESPVGLVVWAWVPLFMITGMIADSFAGERERHTLETLLASRLPDRAILFGKLFAALAYGWGLALAALVTSLVSVNLVYGQGRLLLFPGGTFLAAALLGPLVTGLIAGAGVLVSMRSPTVRQAYQRLSLSILALVFIPSILLQALPAAWHAPIERTLSAIHPAQALITAVAVLATLNAGLLAIILSRFQRTRLVLD